MNELYWVFLGGEFTPSDLLEKPLQGLSGMVCADSGANHTFLLGLVPDLILGDNDSILPEVKEFYQQKNVKFMAYPPNKDFSDGEGVFQLLQEKGALNLVVYGAFGGRKDHELANIFLAAKYSASFERIIMPGNQFTAFYLNGPGSLKIQDHAGPVSIIPLSPQLKSLTLEGFEYPLNKAEVKFGSSLTLSNVLKSPQGEIFLEEGCALIFKY